MLRCFGIAGAVFVIISMIAQAHADGKQALRTDTAPARRMAMACASPLAGGQIDDYAGRYRNQPVFRFLVPSGPAGHIRIFRGAQIDTEACFTGGVHAPPRPAFEIDRGVRVFRGGAADRPYHMYLY